MESTAVFRNRRDLHGRRLQGLSLQGKKMIFTSLEGCDLRHADLREVHVMKSSALRGANLCGADLRGARVDCLPMGILYDEHTQWGLSEEISKRAIWIGPGADLRGAALVNVWLDRMDLRGSDLTAADLRFTNLCGTDLRGCHLERVAFRSTLYDRETKWPEGFDPREGFEDELLEVAPVVPLVAASFR